MTKHSDHQLALALVHDACAYCDGGTGDRELGIICEELALAEVLLSGAANSSDRARVYEVVQPSTRGNYLN